MSDDFETANAKIVAEINALLARLKPLRDECTKIMEAIAVLLYNRGELVDAEMARLQAYLKSSPGITNFEKQRHEINSPHWI